MQDTHPPVPDATLLSTVLEAFSGLYLLLDEDNRILSYQSRNPLYTFPPGIGGRPAAEAFPPAVWEQIAAAIRQARQENTVVSAEFQMAREGKTWRQAARVTVLENGHVILTTQDVTLQKEAEERYRLLAENAADIIWLMDMNLHFTYISPSVQWHRGYTPEEAMVLSLEETLTPSSLANARIAFARALQAVQEMTPEQLRATSLVIELENYCKDGSIIPVESNISFLFDADGRPVGFIGASRNISDRKHIEKRLQEAEIEQRKLTRAVEQSSSAIIVTDKQGVIEYVNPAFSRATGYDAAEVIGKNPRILKSGQHPPEFYQKMWRTLLNGEVWQGELINRKKDGELYWEAATITPVKDENGAITHFLAIKDNVTERKKLAQRVEEQAGLLAAINENIPAVIYQTVIRENEMRIRYVSPQITEIFGLEWSDDLDDSEEHFMRFVAAIHPKDQARFLMSVREAAANHTDWEFEGRFIKPPSGKTIWFKGQARPAVESAGIVFNGVLQDITEQRRWEMERDIQYKQRQILNNILQIGLQEMSLAEQMKQALQEILSVPWLPFMPRGGIFLVEDDPETLVLTAGYNLTPQQAAMCALVPFGRCLCGRAAQTRQVQFAGLINDDHENRYDGMTPHGHYTLPILSGQEVLGVVVLYLPEGHKRRQEEIAFLRSVTDVLAGIIKRKQAENGLRRRRQQAEALQAAAQTLNKSLDLPQALEQILGELQKIVPYDSVTIQLLQGNILTIAAGRGFPNWEKIHGVRFDITADDNPNRLVIQTRQPLILHNPAEQYPQFRSDRHAPAQIASWLGVPLLFQGRIIGMLAIDKQEAGFYTEEHARLAQAFAAQAAIAIENARLFAEATRSAEQARQAQQTEAALRRAVQTLNQSLDLDQALQQILIELQKIVPYEYATIQLRKRDDLVVMAAHGFPEAARFVGYPVAIMAEDNPNRTIISTGQPIILDDPAKQYPLFYSNHPAPEKIRSFMGLPMIFQGRTIGMIAVGWPDAGFYKEPHIRLAQTFATQAAIAIENARLFAEAKQSAEAALQAKQRAEAANRAKSAFLSRVSHELRTPLGSILGYTELFQEGGYGPITPKQARMAEKVVTSAHYLTALVDELLDQARMEAGRINLETVSFNLREMIRRVHDKMDILAQKKNLTLFSKIEADMPCIIVGDEKRLQQILVNLVDNAIKFTSSGTVEIYVYQPEENRWAMRVSDTGPGISLEAQAHIFDSFHQIEDVTTRRHAGFGLGLSIVKQLTALMGGEVIVDSELGKGTVFTVLLPLAARKENGE